jgi:hypothetical protein
MRRIFVLSLLVLGMAAVQGCSGPKDIYPANPWAGEPGIQVIAVAPFLVKPEIATTMHQSFESYTFTTSDGFNAHFSEQFAQEFANGLTEFPGISVINPERVMRAWADSVNKGEMTNPLATREDALKIAQRLKADAILLAEVIEWDPYDGRMTLDWSLHATRTSTIRAVDVRSLENAGKGGLLVSRKDRSGGAVFCQLISLDKESRRTKELLTEYANSLAAEESAGYPNPEDGIVGRPFPRFIRFASWVAMTSAYKATTKTQESTASGE